MSIGYRIYSNQGTGAPVDFSAPVASTTALTYGIGPLGVSTDTTFVVRAYDTTTGLEQAGGEASVRVVIGADGTDVSGLPNAPHALALAPAFNGGARVTWAYAPSAAFGSPTGFNIYLTQGSSQNTASPTATVGYIPGRVGYSYTLPGPYTLSTYTVGVRAFNAAGIEANTGTVTVALGLPSPFAMDSVQVTIGAPSQ